MGPAFFTSTGLQGAVPRKTRRCSPYSVIWQTDHNAAATHREHKWCLAETGGRMPQFPATNNRILRALPASEFDHIAADLVVVDLAHGAVLAQPDEAPANVYFPESGVISSVTLLENGASVEAATIGREGMVGLCAFLGGTSATQFVIQVADGALRMTAENFRRHLETSPVLRAIVGLYANAYMAQLSQASACNAVHDTNERCARWLLATHDRCGRTQEFSLTQEFIATMLGVHRPTVTLAIGTLQQAGLIRYRRGHVTIVDRGGLEGASCECYGVTARRFDSVFVNYPGGRD
jgi:CRP-like cAMP-binding protein